MKRLREQQGSTDPLLARAGAILSKVEPTAESPARMRRIRRTLDRVPKRYALRLLRPVAVFGLITGIAATAAAAFGVARMVSKITEQPQKLERGTHNNDRPTTRGTPPARMRSEVLLPQKPQRAEELPQSDNAAIDTTKDVTSTSNKFPPSGGHASRGEAQPRQALEHDRRATKPTPAPSPSKPSSASEARVVQQGLEALRKHNDPKQAAVYLRRYRNKHPDGTLAEEALALSVEAASASDAPEAKQLAVEYLSRYPQGRFRNAARQALAKALAPRGPKRQPKKSSPRPHKRVRP